MKNSYTGIRTCLCYQEEQLGKVNIEELLHEGMTIQERLESDKEGIKIAKTSLKFKNFMSKGNNNRALKLLKSNMLNPLVHDVHTKRSQILKQTCSVQLQLCLSISDFLVDIRH